MADIESLLLEQSKTGQIIQNIVSNYKKDGANRKVKKQYFDDRQRQLTAAWDNFENIDNRIRTNKNVPLDNEYFTTDYYAKIKEMYDTYSIIFEEASASFEEEPQGTSATYRKKVDEHNSKQGEQSVNSRDTDNSNGLSKAKIEGMIRKQLAMSSSLQRLLTGIDRSQESSINYKKTQLELLNKLWNETESLNYSIWEVCADPTSAGYDIESYIMLEEAVRSKRIFLCANDQDTVEGKNNRSESLLQLPKITIPKFDGDYLKWQQFRDIFKKMIHEQNMSAVQKMWYLKANVSGEAERLIRHLQLSEENYESAWHIMQDRFNNKRVLSTALLNKILAQRPTVPEASSIKNLHDSVKESLLALNNIGIQTTGWDPLLLHLLVKKLDHQTHALFEQSLTNPRELQTIDVFLTFLQNRFQSLEAIGRKEKPQHTTVTSAIHENNSDKFTKCSFCNINNHPIYYCERFIKMCAADRLKWIQKQNLCVNCLRSGHTSRACSSRSCNKCSQKHNTLLHLDNNRSRVNKVGGYQLQNQQTAPSSLTPSNKTPSATLAAYNSCPQTQKYVLLATAKIVITANNGQTNTFRAILDSGSQINIVTERLIKHLAIKPSAGSVCIEGIGQNVKTSKHRINLTMKSSSGKFFSRFEAFILPKIVSPQPTQLLDTSKWHLPANLELADPEFSKTNKIDVLLGAEFYHELMLPEKIKLAKNLPMLQNSVFGWLVCGRVDQPAENSVTCAIYDKNDLSTDELIERFWKLDDLQDSQTNNFTTAEQYCEKHFMQNFRRDPSGRFIVRLPFSDNPSALRDSRAMALSRFLALEKRLSRDAALKADYSKFMKEYEALKHMTEIPADDIPASHYIIPHHCVLRPGKSTTKLRVVFDASAKTSSGVSLNDILHSGPSTQSDLFSILLRFRLHRYVFTTDIEKMYRQVLIDTMDKAYQLILWRNEPTENLKYFHLNTVTYGTTSAPYLATKCLQVLAVQHTTSHPLGAQALRDDFYVDDGLSGSDTLTTALEMQSQLIALLTGAGFKPHKWCANHPKLLQGISKEDQEVNLDFDSDEVSTIKTLGLTWRPKADAFCVKVKVSDSTLISKRVVTSNLAQIFDPLGILGPVVVVAKLFIQQLWEMKLSWDEELPSDLRRFWVSFCSNLSTLNQTQIPRHMFDKQIPLTVQIHVFADASERAFGAVAYLRSTHSSKRVLVRMLCSKSRVAPLKKQTLPRLELCAALLGAELAARVSKDLCLVNSPTYLWTDSEIVLQWINSTASSFHTFVANRVSKIQQLSCANQWRHVRSQHNPADFLSRGLTPDKLLSCNLWLYGPLFLHGDESMMPPPFSRALAIESDLEKKKKTAMSVATISSALEELVYNLNHRNSFTFLLRVVAYILRFVKNLKSKQRGHSQGTLSPGELHGAQSLIVKAIQHSDFREDLTNLKHHKAVSKSSPISSLNPYIDDDGLLRVGGRLEASELPYDRKHPVILPYNDPIAKLIFKKIHVENMHCGSQTLLALVRLQFWPIKGKSTARHVVQNCIRCVRAKPRLMNQVMGDLPIDRVTPARPFLNTGVDYWGPLWVHYKVRGKKPHKVYVAVFCCFATKAIHLEVVSDLTTEAFIAALKRFISRRGRCKTLYCDNATNFVGANNQLQELNKTIYTTTAQETITNACSQKGIEFKFIPPRAPHFGGLWEAAVKSAKHLVLKNVSTASLTYEELETVIIETEAILNSRPITPMSSDPTDLTALTPGHFLIGEPLVAQVDAVSNDKKRSLTARWRLISQLKQEFWSRWTRDYLQELQQRHKWRQQVKNVTEGTMVVIKEDNTPPLEWPLGRIVRTYKGHDGFIRVADVRTATGTWKRPIHRLAPLPVESVAKDECEKKSPAQRTEEDKEVPNKRMKFSPWSSVIMILSLVLLPVILAHPVDITTFETNPGLYFDALGSTNLITADWKIIVYYDLIPIKDELNTLINGTYVLQHLCNKLPQDVNCSPLVDHYLHVSTDLRVDNAMLLRQRKKRGALDIVGNIANKLFGVLDSDYARDMSATIHKINNNEININDILKTHTSVIDSTINVMKRNQYETMSRLNYLREKTNEILKEVNQEKRQAKIFQNFISLSLQLSIITAELQRIQSAIINVITNTHHEKISPLLLSPEQLKGEAARIRNNLSPTQQLPYQGDDILHLFKLMTSQAGISDHHIIFVINLPLIEHEQFDLFRLIPVPTWYNNALIAITTDTEILATNKHRDQYFPLSLAELKSCRSLKESSYICLDKQSKFMRDSGFLSCEINLLNNGTSKDCKTTTLHDSPLWVQLSHNNQWIYATKEAVQLTAVCGTGILKIELIKSGLISIQPDCVIKNNLITFRGHPVVNTTMQVSYAAFGNLTTMKNPISVMALLKNNTIDVSQQIEQLTNLQNVLKSTDIRDSLEGLQFDKTHHFTIGYSALTISIVVMCLLSFIIFRHCKRSAGPVTKGPPPKPRRLSAQPTFTIHE